MSSSSRVLVLALQDSECPMTELVGRVRGVGLAPVPAHDFEMALRVVGEGENPITAGLLPSDFPANQIRDGVRQLLKAGSPKLQFVAVGPALARDERRRWRKAGVKLALWEPFDDGTLRFQLNRALATGLAIPRGQQRVPTVLLATIEVGGRKKDAVVYSLSRSGAFLETPRASPAGAEVQVEIRLPSGPVESVADVVFSNVPGNLQRPNLPMGMAVRFRAPSSRASRALRSYVKERVAALEM
ncbi:MAG: PilZ domain-containing protein [Proteobacteria bacterium]|nr:PilZ domain-containing protein [Pseudomonadota bacterium]